MEDTIDWLRTRPYYQSQINSHRVISGRTAEYSDLALDDRLAATLTEHGVPRLYAHQADAISTITEGQNAVIATPTASGKSLCYTIPAFERALEAGARTLYVAPQVALINDQEETLSTLARGLGFGTPVRVDQYTGRLSQPEKRQVRDRQPTMVLMTPDMLHYGLLPHAHRLWDWFFESLEYIVLDEIHEYRGVFGSQVALVLRRLNRIADRFDQSPQYICCSATIRNPRDHASALTNHPPDSFAITDYSASETGPSHWLFWNPPPRTDNQTDARRRSNHTETKRLFIDLVARGHQTVVFTRARQAAERYATECAEALVERGEHELADAVTAYQAALNQERRDEIEAGLQSGRVRGVWSTNALELGVDIGGLDAVLLDGYPGTRLATVQQAGRAGRGTEPSLVVLVGSEDQLDQYFMANPDEFFSAEMERAVANPTNEELLPDHIQCAARENWLAAADKTHFGAQFPAIVRELLNDGRLEQRETDAGIRWTYAGDGSPQHEMSLRSIDDRDITLLDRRSDAVIGTLPFTDAIRDAHPGAIYHHQGTTYEVTDLDLTRDTARLDPTHADYYTQILHDKQIEVLDDHDEKPLPAGNGATIRFASIRLHKQITGFQRKDPATGDTHGEVPLDLPATSLTTDAFYFTIPDALEATMRSMEGDFAGGIHAAEHGMIAMFPLEVLCDRRDIGGLSTPRHPHTDRSTIFIYDGYPGGVGLTQSGYTDVASLMAQTHAMIAACDCTAGCPACVQSPHCGNANDPLDKHQALFLLESLTADASR